MSEEYPFDKYGDNKITLVNEDESGTKEYEFNDPFVIGQENVEPGILSTDDTTATFILPGVERIGEMLRDICDAMDLSEPDFDKTLIPCEVNGEDKTAFSLSFNARDGRKVYFRSEEAFDNLENFEVEITFNFEKFKVTPDNEFVALFTFHSISIRGEQSSSVDHHRRMMASLMASRMRERQDITEILKKNYVSPIERKESKLNEVYTGTVAVGFELATS